MPRTSTKAQVKEPAARADRRAGPRLYFNADITFTSGNNFYAGRALDISAGGLFFETRAPLEIGAKVRVRLQVLDKPFAVTAKVCWIQCDRVGRPRGAGVSFVNLPAPMREAIAEFMRQRAPIQFEFEPPEPPEPSGDG